MKKINYYLVASSNGVAKVMNIPFTFFHETDITDIDDYTMNFSKEELDQQFFGKDKAQKDYHYFIVHPIFNRSNNQFRLKYYEVILRNEESSKYEQQLSDCLAGLAKVRNQKFQKKMDSLAVNETSLWDDTILSLIDHILSNDKIRHQVLDKKSIVHFKVKEDLAHIKTNQDQNYWVNESKKYLISYKEVRGLFLEYIQAINPKKHIKYDTSYRNQFVYDSRIFGYQTLHYFSLDSVNRNINLKENMKYLEPYDTTMDEDLKMMALQKELNRTPFDHKEVGELYASGGLPLLDQQGYSLAKLMSDCTLEDLVRLDLLSIDNYFIQKKQRNRS